MALHIPHLHLPHPTAHTPRRAAARIRAHLPFTLYALGTLAGMAYIGYCLSQI